MYSKIMVVVDGFIVLAEEDAVPCFDEMGLGWLHSCTRSSEPRASSSRNATLMWSARSLVGLCTAHGLGVYGIGKA